MGRPLIPCTRCGGPRRLESFQGAELEACTQCGAVTLTRSDLLSLSGHASPIPVGGLLGLRRQAHPTLMPEEEVLDELRPPSVSSVSPTDEFAFVPQNERPPEPDESLKAEITYTPLPEHPILEPDDAEPAATEHAPAMTSPRPSRVPTLVPDDMLPEEEEPEAPSLDDLPGRPPEPVGGSGASLGDSFDDDFFSDEVARPEPEWELPPPTDETEQNEPGLGGMFDRLGPETDEVPTTIDQSWATRQQNTLEPETVQSQPELGSMSMHGEFQPQRVDPSISDYGNQGRRRNRLLLLAALAIVFFVGVPLIAVATLTVLQNQEGNARKPSPTSVPGQSMADALTRDPVTPPTEVAPDSEAKAPSTAPSAPPEPKSEVTVETPETPPVQPAPKPKEAPAKPKPSASSTNTTSAGWNKVNSDPAAATVIFQTVLDGNPGDADARYGLGYAMLQAGDATGALPHLCRARSRGGVEIQREVTGLLSTKGLSCP